MNYFITGFPGTGKTAVARGLRDKGYVVYDVDEEKDLTKWVNKETREMAKDNKSRTEDFYDKHAFNWNRDYLKRLLSQSKDKLVFIVGITSNQSDDLDLFTKVFLLQAERDVLRQRMINRKEHDLTKKDKEVDIHFSWHESFDQQMLMHGAIPVDASLPLDQVVQVIEKEVVK